MQEFFAPRAHEGREISNERPVGAMNGSMGGAGGPQGQDATSN